MARPRFRTYPHNGTIAIANGEILPYEVTGNFINVKQADQSFTIRLDGSEELKATQNRRFRLTEDDQFKTVEIINDSGSTLNVQLEIGFGDVESDDVSISGTVTTSDSTAQAKLDTLATLLGYINTNAGQIEALLTNDEDLRAAAYVIGSNTATTAAAGNTTLIDATTDNPSGGNGVIIRTFSHIDSNNSQEFRFSVNGTVIYRNRSDGGRTFNNALPLPLVIPAGQEVVVFHDDAAGKTDITWDAL